MIPTTDDVRSAPLVHRFGDLFNPPGLTNHRGCVQVEFDLTAIRALSFPPLGSGDSVTAQLFLNDRYFLATGTPITFTWSPDRIERTAQYDGLGLRSTTVMPFGARAALVLLEIRNDSGVERDVPIRLALQTLVTRQDEAWLQPPPPATWGHTARVDADAGGVVFAAPDGRAFSAQAAFPTPDRIGPAEMHWIAHLQPGETFRLAFANAYGDSDREALDEAARLTRDARAQLENTTAAWNDELRATFTPGNDVYGGSLPVLETDDADLRRAYWLGVLGVTYFRRETPTFGRSYDTLMPRYWQTVTFLWDYSLSSIVHSMLDPGVMRTHIEHWMTTDVHTCFGTEWLTGGPVGGWYSVNDYAMTKLIYDRVRWSGDRAWLDARVDGVDVYERMALYATNWESFRTDSGLADYGGIGNLLECVSTYVHEVAAMNAANAWSMRATADVAGIRGDDARARDLRARATDVVDAVQKLYADGQGFWRARFPDGSLVDVRHCYDFITILTTIDRDLSDAQRAEMVGFFEREFYSPTWMHALAPSDPDSIFSVRPDHQWNGAYPAWPPLAVLGLLRAGREDLAASWMRGLGKSANQGPYGQAHFADAIVEPEAGGSRKSPSDFPYICDWTVSSGGAWVQAIVEGFFGVDARLDGITATPQLASFDPDARLRNLPYQGSYYDVDARGIREVSP